MDDLLSNLKIKHPTILVTINEIDLNNLNSLDKINPISFNSLLILSPSGTTIEEMDAYVISLLIRIRQILRKNLSQMNGQNLLQR